MVRRATKEQLDEVFNYNPDTGIITHKKGKNEGSEAGTLNARGYRAIAIAPLFTSPVEAHRIAYCMATGSWPMGAIDHINGIKDDNRACNLRDVRYEENNHNILRARLNNSSGFKGVSFHKRYQTWRVNLTFEGKAHHIGVGRNKYHAAALYNKALLRKAKEKAYSIVVLNNVAKGGLIQVNLVAKTASPW